MKSRFYPLFSLLLLVGCSDTEQPVTTTESPSTFGAEQFDELKNQIAMLANQNADRAASEAEVRRLRDELDRQKTANAARLQLEAELCQ